MMQAVFGLLATCAFLFVPACGSRGGSEKVPAWWTPFQRHHSLDPLEFPECRNAAPGFDPDVLAVRDAIKPIKTLRDLRRLKPGQKVLVVAPRFGLGNTLRNWVSAFYWGFFSGRRIVLLHGGKFHGVFTSLCAAFHCAFDHIQAENEKDAVALLKKFQVGFSPRVVLPGREAFEALFWEDPIVFSYSYGFWDHWWTNNRTLGRCGCKVIVSCKAGTGFRGVAVQALLSGGPTEALRETIEEVLTLHRPDKSQLKLPLPEHMEDEMDQFRAINGLAVQFDVGFHVRTRTQVLERPGKPFSACATPDCGQQKNEEIQRFRAELFKPEVWECIDLFLRQLAHLKNRARAAALSIFLATDNMVLRDELVQGFAQYGPVYFNNGTVAHVGVSSASDRGRLPTMAEFFLLSKSHVIIELDRYFSTFSHFSMVLGNASTLVFPRQELGREPNLCAFRNPNNIGVWRNDDPRRMNNYLFMTEGEPHQKKRRFWTMEGFGHLLAS